MKILDKMRLEFKIICIVSIAAISFIATLAIYYSISIQNTRYLTVLHDKTYPLAQLSKLSKASLLKVEDLYLNAVSANDEDIYGESVETSENLKKLLAEITVLDKAQTDSIQKLNTNLNLYLQANKKLFSIVSDSQVDYASISGLAVKRRGLYTSTNDILSNYEKAITNQFNHHVTTMLDNSKYTLYKISIVGAVLLFIMLAFAWLMTKNIIKTIHRTAVSFGDLAAGKGDLDMQLTVYTNDDLGKLSGHFNDFMMVLKMLISDVTQVALPLNMYGDDLKKRMQEVTDMATTHAGEAEDIQDAMLKMQTSVEDVNDSVSDASLASVEANEQVNIGTEVLELSIINSSKLNKEITQTSNVVNELAENAINMNSVLDIISEIAEQTNLLALNAAIEAARAGEQGRGFAVVADEVRSLASRSASASDEIRNMLNILVAAANDSVETMQLAQEQSQINTDHAQSAGEALKIIRGKIVNIVEVNAKIVSATKLQSITTTDAKNKAAHMCTSIIDSRAIVEDMSQVALAMSEFSKALVSTTSKFKLASAEEELF